MVIGPERVAGETPTRSETEAERFDRNFHDLLQELRVAQAGTQILFAFLLSVAFTVPFQQSDDFTHRVYAVTLVLSALATAMLITPAAMHRIMFRRGLKGSIVRVGSVLALSGLYLLMGALAGGLLLALDVALSRGQSILITSLITVVFVALWVVLPLVMLAIAPRETDAHDLSSAQDTSA
jgi:hypothetical protein